MKANNMILKVTGTFLIALITFGTVGSAQSAKAATYRQDGGTEGFGEISIDAPTQIQIEMNSEQPKMTPEQTALMEDALSQTKMRGPQTPIGPNASTRNAPPEIPETSIDTAGQKAAGTFTIFQNSSLAGGPSKSQVSEPSVANNGQNIFATYNWYAALSTNYGSTWSYTNPATAFSSAHNGFCCDQDVFYDPSRDLTFWLLQYVKDGNGNILRLAVSKGQADLAAGNWYYYDLAPEMFSGTSNSDWFDFPHLTRTDNYLYLSSNIFTTGGSFLNTAMIRLSLDQLAAAGGLSIGEFYWSSGFTFTAAHGGTNTLYWARHLNTTQLRVYTWPESATSSGVTFTDVTHASHLTSGYNCTVTASGINPCGFDDDRVIAGWLRRSNNELGFMWDAAQGVDGLGSFAYPHVRVLTMNATTKAVVTDGNIWNSTTAWLIPSAGGNARGHVGGTIAWAGGASQPSCGAWLYDDYSAGIAPLEVAGVSYGDTSPSANRWGDYLRTRQNSQNPYQFIGTCYAIEGGVTTPRIVRFGRERDTNLPTTVDTTGVFRPGNGLLYLKHANTTGFADISINYGVAGDYPVAGDWDGNGTATIGIYRNGIFYLRNSNTLGFADLVFAYGSPGDQPVVGDWDRDGIDTIGVYRGSTVTFYLRNSNSAGAPTSTFALGLPGDVGIAGDWNGDGLDTTGVFRPGNGVLFLKNANTTGFADIAINYGIGGDQPVTGDWNGDGTDTIGVYRNAQFMLRNSNTLGFADLVFGLGIPGDMPIAGNWDGSIP